MGLLIFFFLLSIIVSFLCSVWEAVLLSITPSFVEVQYKEGTRTGQLLKVFKEDIDRPLSAILTLNTIAHTVGAIGVGAQAGEQFGDKDLIIGGLSMPFSVEALVGAVMTLAILILSEIIPKTVGANNWKRLSGFTVTSLNFIIYALYPLVWVSQFITKSLKKDKEKSVLSRADFSAMAEIGEKEGIFRSNESRIIHNLLRLNTIRTKDVMTPRTVVKAANQDRTIAEFYENNPKLQFSRIPVFAESKDHINGFVLKDEILSSIISQQGGEPLKSIMREILIINEQVPLPDLFNQLMEKREHIALVVDEFGGMGGIVTMEDVIETLLGIEIVDEQDNIEDMQMLARKNWEKRAQILGLLEEFREEAPAPPKPEEE
ncbi:CNNM domain-containing protein [Phaeodactylibacter luteus]|uniref:HlyC/CorC family transporter n=1 Tax=Phaeodactylibacter luteus TaxID=1564516 RepID=A0A5C6S4T5_9BACT|nr:hemolysin family protein [Phaeodactylibacter luteus]TXB69423.1 HlyC/CorC family transporter [Phaeodactylibacter luteus]